MDHWSAYYGAEHLGNENLEIVDYSCTEVFAVFRAIYESTLKNRISTNTWSMAKKLVSGESSFNFQNTDVLFRYPRSRFPKCQVI